MYGAIRNSLKCIKETLKKSAKTQKTPKPKKTELKAIPVFQYPLSEEGDRRVYVWGLAAHGALGTLNRCQYENGIPYVHAPKRLTFGELHKVVNVACGYGFTLFAVHSKDKNIVYGSGINTDSQIGYHDTDKKYPDNIIAFQRPINLPIKDNSTKVVDLAAGRAHSLVLTTEGLYTLGNNAYGQCGRPIIENEDYTRSLVVHHIPNIKGKRITAVTAGQDHSVLLTETGEVYTFGWGADGQTGLAHYRNEYRPSLVKGDLAGQNIIKVACAGDCVLALSDKGKVFGWGNAEYGQLPAQDGSHQINIATELTMEKEIGHVIDIASGGCFCMILNSLGKVYVWGYGILGFGPEVTRVGKPTMIPETLFGNNPYQAFIRVVKIYCGMSHLAALTNTGDLYTWGCNKFGSLGLGHSNDQFFPLKVSLSAQAKKIACGIDHTVALCKPFV